MLEHTEQDVARAKALRSAEYASLTRRAVTANSHALIDEVYRRVAEYEIQNGLRKRKRADKAQAFIDALEGFVGDLLEALGQKELSEGWVYRAVTARYFTDDAVSFRDFEALRNALVPLALVEEAKAVQFWGDFGSGPFVAKRFSTRFRATKQLEELATAHGVSPLHVGKHFITDLPKHPLVLKGGSRRAPEGYKIPGKPMKFTRNGGLAAMEQTIKNLNTFIDQFTIRGGTHRGYIRVFNCGNHGAFKWNLGGRFYSQGADSYQQMKSAERLKMTIDGKPVCELDIKASYLTIFQARGGQPVDFDSDPYAVGELGATPRIVVKAFITATFGMGQFPDKWSKRAVSDYKAQTKKSLKKLYPINKVRDAVAKAYPLLAGLRQDEEQPPIWATLMYLESQALFRTMLALRERDIPSLSVHDSLIVQRDNEQVARATLSELYGAATGATAHIVTKGL
jgi:hypothetical protein